MQANLTAPLFAALQGLPGVSVEGQALLIILDEDKFGQEVADAVAEQVRQNLRNGLGPDGQALPPLASATLERRRRRVRHEGGSATGGRGFVTGALSASIRAKHVGRGHFYVTAEEHEAAFVRTIGSEPRVDMDQPLIRAAMQSALDRTVQARAARGGSAKPRANKDAQALASALGSLSNR